MIDIACIPKDHDEGVIDVMPMLPTTAPQSEARKLRNRRPVDLAVGILGSPHVPVDAGSTLTLRPDITERNEPPTALIPQYKLNAAKALKQREPADATQIGIVAKRLWQPVVGYTATQMVDMVHADVRCEPAQNSRQVVIRTSTKRRLGKTPFRTMRPERLFELMLHVK